MTVNDPVPGLPQLRVSDAERNAAMDALGEHLSAGRLDVDEYGTRSAQLATARTTADLNAPFADLPGPHPQTTMATAPPFAPTAVGGSSPATGITPAAGPHPGTPARSRSQQVAAAVAGGSGIIALILFFSLSAVWDEAWLVFLMVPLVYVVAGAVWGPDWRDGAGGRNRGARRDQRDRRRER